MEKLRCKGEKSSRVLLFLRVRLVVMSHTLLYSLISFSEQSLAHFSAFIWCVCAFILFVHTSTAAHTSPHGSGRVREGAWEARHVAPSRPTLLFLLFHRARARGRPPTRPRLSICDFCTGPLFWPFSCANSPTAFHAAAKKEGESENSLLCFPGGVTRVNLMLL
jgi:hypothetical protein